MDERLSLVSTLPIPAPRPKIDTEGIAMLEKWIALLRSGEMAAVAIAGISEAGTSTSYSGAPHDMIGAVVMLQHRITLAMYGDN